MHVPAAHCGVVLRSAITHCRQPLLSMLPATNHIGQAKLRKLKRHRLRRQKVTCHLKHQLLHQLVVASRPEVLIFICVLGSLWRQFPLSSSIFLFILEFSFYPGFLTVFWTQRTSTSRTSIFKCMPSVSVKFLLDTIFSFNPGYFLFILDFWRYFGPNGHRRAGRASPGVAVAGRKNRFIRLRPSQIIIAAASLFLLCT